MPYLHHTLSPYSMRKLRHVLIFKHMQLPAAWLLLSSLQLVYTWLLLFSLPFCPTVSTNVSVVDVPPPTEGGSGSGFEAIEQMTSSFEFPLTEDVGQLYSYRLNSSAAVLGTRRWQLSSGQNVTIGVQQTGNGMYLCLAANANEESMRTVTITVLQGTEIHCSCVRRSINSPRILK